MDLFIFLINTIFSEHLASTILKEYVNPHWVEKDFVILDYTIFLITTIILFCLYSLIKTISKMCKKIILIIILILIMATIIGTIYYLYSTSNATNKTNSIEKNNEIGSNNNVAINNNSIATNNSIDIMSNNKLSLINANFNLSFDAFFKYQNKPSDSNINNITKNNSTETIIKNSTSSTKSNSTILSSSYDNITISNITINNVTLLPINSNPKPKNQSNSSTPICCEESSKILCCSVKKSTKSKNTLKQYNLLIIEGAFIVIIIFVPSSLIYFNIQYKKQSKNIEKQNSKNYIQKTYQEAVTNLGNKESQAIRINGVSTLIEFLLNSDESTENNNLHKEFYIELRNIIFKTLISHLVDISSREYEKYKEHKEKYEVNEEKYKVKGETQELLNTIFSIQSYHIKKQNDTIFSTIYIEKQNDTNLQKIINNIINNAYKLEQWNIIPNLQGIHLEVAYLQNANFNKIILIEAKLQKADLRYATLQEADLQGAKLYGAKLQGASLYGANLQGANLQYADLEWTSLYRANLYEANLQEANLQNTNLRYANLQEADLQGASLQNTNLRYANLQEADLQGASLQYADLEWTSLYRANLQEANLQNTIVELNALLSVQSLKGATIKNLKKYDDELNEINWTHEEYEKLKTEKDWDGKGYFYS